MNVYPRNLFIVVVLGVQALLPIAYYAGNNPYDERFAWRMFSDTRLVKCSTEFRAKGQPSNIEHEIHESWATLLARARPGVVDGMVRKLCHDSGGPVTVAMTCKMTDGTTMQAYDGKTDLCP
ncbi:MAG: hypothetical protein WCG92_19920 [Hyphomicrobiales bacterium]